MRWTVITAAIMVLLLNGTLQAQDAAPAGAQTPLAILGGTVEQTLPETRSLSPDGTMLVGFGANGLCLFLLNPPAGQCFAAPFTWTPLHLIWSPDSRRIAFTPDVFGEVIEGDIWVFDVANRTFVNRTEDNLNEIQPVPGMILDYAPFWHPVTGELYFFRSETVTTPGGQVGWTQTMRRMPADGGDVALVLDLSSRFPPFSIYESDPPLYLHSPAVISPDGTRVAVLVRGQDPADRRNGVWLLRLDTPAEPLRLTRARLTSGMPAWQLNDNMFISGMTWTRDSAALVMATFDPSLNSVVFANLYYFDLATGDITPLFDFSAAAQTDFFALSAAQVPMSMYVPQGAVLHPTANQVLTFGAVSGEIGPAALFSIGLPPSAPPTVNFAQQLNRTEAQPTQPASAGGGSVFMGGYLFTLGA